MIASIDVELATCRVNDFFMQHYIIENDFVLIKIFGDIMIFVDFTSYIQQSSIPVLKAI